MEQMHSLLKRQLGRCFGDQFCIPKEWQEFIDTVNDAYQKSDIDREVLENSLEQSSQELIHANSEVRAIFSETPDLLFRLDKEGRILNYKTGATTDLLLSPKELLGKRIQDVPLQQIGGKFHEAIQQARELKTIVSIEYSLSIQGQPLFFEARLVPLPEDQIVTIIRNITERKRAEDALRKSEERFRHIWQDSMDGMRIIDENGIILLVNKAFCKMMKKDRHELEGQPFHVSYSNLHPQQIHRDIELLQQRIRTHTMPEHNEFKVILWDGSERWFEVTDSLLNLGDQVPNILTIFRDITERKKSEIEFRKLSQAVEQSQVSVIITDIKGNIEYVNSKFIEVTGYSKEEMIGQNPRILKSGFTPPEEYKDMWNTINSGNEWNGQFFNKKKNGEYYWESVSLSPVKNEAGDITHILAVKEDITERKKAEEELFASQQMLRMVLDNIPQRVFWKDRQLFFVGCNKYLALDCGYTDTDQLIGKTDYETSSAQIADSFRADDRQVIETGKSKLNYEESQIRPDGSIGWLRTSKVPLRDKNGNVIGILGTYEDITEQKRALEALNLLSHTVKSIGESISITNLENKLLFVNEAFLKTYGYTEEEIIGRHISIVSCDPTAQEQTIFVETLQGGWQGELLNKKKDGTIFPIHLSTSIVYNEKGQPIGLVGVAIDITERKRTEEALQESEERFRSLYENASIGIYRTTPDGRILLANPAAIRMLNFNSIDDLAERDLERGEFEPSYSRKAFRERLDREGVIIGMESSWIRMDGSIIYIRESAKAIRDEKGMVLYYDGTMEDITERKQAEEALQESQALYRSFVEHLPASVFRKDSKGRYVFVNSMFCQLVGLNMDEVVGKTPVELEAFVLKEKAHRPSLMNAVQGILANESTTHHEIIMRTGKTIEVEEVFPQLDGTSKYFHVVKSPVFASDGKIIGTQGVQFDITERKRAEEALRESDEKLRNIVEHSTNLFYSRNTDQVFTYLSPQAKDIFDCEPDEAMVRFSDFMTDNPINKLGCELAEKAVQSGARQETYELELMSRKGRHVWIEIQEAPVVKDGKTVFIVGAATDITERRWAEMALQVSEKKYRDIVTWAPVGIYQSTLSGKILSGNSSIAKMLGYDNVNELIGCNMGQYIYYDEKDRERFIAENDSSEEKVTSSHETRWKKKDGSIIWVLMTIYAVRDKSSEILYYEGFVFDITERKHAEEALRESEERYRLLVENSTDIVTEISAENKYLYVSPNVKSILDFEPNDMVGTNVLSRVYGKDKAIIGEILSKLGGSATYRYRDRTGGWHWFESSGRFYYTSSGEQRMVMVSRDITQRRKAEQEIELSRKQLQHFTEHLEQVLEEERKRISRELHDELGQLLTVLKFDLSWLKLDKVKSDSNINARIDEMMESVNEALASVKRISKEIRPPQLDALGLVGAIQWDIDQAEKKTGLKGIVTVELADDEIKGQISTVLYRVFREALTNILRHANAKQIFIKLSQRLGSIIFTIRDDGRGVTKKELQGTTSLGIVGIRERVRMVGGTFTIEGKTGSGTLLSVEVPLKKMK